VYLCVLTDFGPTKHRQIWDVQVACMLDVRAAEQKEVEALGGSRVWVVPEEDSNLYNSFGQMVATLAEVTSSGGF